MKQLDYNSEMLCFLCGPCRDVRDRDRISSVREFMKAEKSSLLEAVARERLVKTQEAVKG
jgi:hypothetical protein